MNFNQSPPRIYRGDDPADVSLALSAANLLLLASGDLNPQQAVIDGKLRISGELDDVLLFNLVLALLVR